jgi:uncharacterized protein (DUF362 family)
MAERMVDSIRPVGRRDAPVALLRTAADQRQVHEDVRRVMELARWRDFISAGAEVAIKPNLGWDKLIPGAISAPWVVEGVVRTIREHVGAIHLVESDQVVVSADRALAVSGLDRVCRRHGIQWHNMSRAPHLKLQLPDARVLREVEIPEILTRCELITLPVLKTHNKTVLTGALKNQWGCLRELRHNYHPVLDDALADVNRLVQPRFSVMDGTVGLEGNGPKSGMPKEMGVVLASANLVGIDAAAARLMGVDPASVAHLRSCSDAGLGAVVSACDVVGDPVSEASKLFLPARHNPVSWIEFVLRRSVVERLAFHSPLFHLMCWGARRYYDVWDILVGRRRRQSFFASSPWARQWSSD